MASNQNSTGNSKVKQFRTCSAFERYCIFLKNEGKTWDELHKSVYEEYPDYKKLAPNTIRQWFIPGGCLEEANIEYLETLASESLKEAKLLARRVSKTAIATMSILMGQQYDPNIRLGAAKAIANKYIPDRQVVVGQSSEEEIPEELGEEGDDIIKETIHDEERGKSGVEHRIGIDSITGNKTTSDRGDADSSAGLPTDSEPNQSAPANDTIENSAAVQDDSPEGQGSGEQAGSGGSEEIPEGILPEQATPGGVVDPQT